MVFWPSTTTIVAPEGGHVRSSWDLCMDKNKHESQVLINAAFYIP